MRSLLLGCVLLMGPVAMHAQLDPLSKRAPTNNPVTQPTLSPGVMQLLQLDAQFAGFAQILIYIGAVAILVVFAILLTRGSETPKDGVYSGKPLVGLAVAAGVFAVLGWAVLHSTAALPGAGGTPAAKPQVTVMDIGNALMGRYVLPLEIVALLLTAALIGAVIVAMHEKEGAR